MEWIPYDRPLANCFQLHFDVHGRQTHSKWNTSTNKYRNTPLKFRSVVPLSGTTEFPVSVKHSFYHSNQNILQQPWQMDALLFQKSKIQIQRPELMLAKVRQAGKPKLWFISLKCLVNLLKNERRWCKVVKTTRNFINAESFLRIY